MANQTDQPKQNHTKFIKADFHTNGLMDSGNPYDEYLDESTYIVRFPNGERETVVLKMN